MSIPQIYESSNGSLRSLGQFSDSQQQSVGELLVVPQTVIEEQAEIKDTDSGNLNITNQHHTSLYERRGVGNFGSASSLTLQSESDSLGFGIDWSQMGPGSLSSDDDEPLEAPNPSYLRRTGSNSSLGSNHSWGSQKQNNAKRSPYDNLPARYSRTVPPTMSLFGSNFNPAKPIQNSNILDAYDTGKSKNTVIQYKNRSETSLLSPIPRPATAIGGFGAGIRIVQNATSPIPRKPRVYSTRPQSMINISEEDPPAFAPIKENGPIGAGLGTTPRLSRFHRPEPLNLNSGNDSKETILLNGHSTSDLISNGSKQTTENKRASFHGPQSVSIPLPLSATNATFSQRNLLTPSTESFNYSSRGRPKSPMPFSRQEIQSLMSPPPSKEFKFGSESTTDPSMPFNYNPIVVRGGAGTLSVPNSKMNSRRGHKYKHSSISLNMFEEPEIRAPLPVPASLPIPTFNDCIKSMTKDQKIIIGFCLFHFLIALLLFTSNTGSSAITSLAHLVFYDAASSTILVGVDIVGNFESWKQSSVRHPFGLERIEILSGFALSIFLVFMGGDILSHSVEECVEFLFYDRNGETNGGHHHGVVHMDNDAGAAGLTLDHDHTAGSVGLAWWIYFEFLVIFELAVTLISAKGLSRFDKLGKESLMKKANEKIQKVWYSLGSNNIFANNPSNVITIIFSFILLIYPLGSHEWRERIDEIISPLIGISMCYFGSIIARYLAEVLLLSFTGDDKINLVAKKILNDPCVREVTSLKFSQIHYGLYIAGIKITITGTDDDESRIRLQARKTLIDVMVNDQNNSKNRTINDITILNGNLPDSSLDGYPKQKTQDNVGLSGEDVIKVETTIDITII